MGEGLGILIVKNKVKYIGQWKNDKFDGKGVLCFDDGKRYEGDFKQNAMDGNGIYYYANGQKKAVEYKNGKIVKISDNIALLKPIIINKEK